MARCDTRPRAIRGSLVAQDVDLPHSDQHREETRRARSGSIPFSSLLAVEDGEDGMVDADRFVSSGNLWTGHWASHHRRGGPLPRNDSLQVKPASRFGESPREHPSNKWSGPAWSPPCHALSQCRPKELAWPRRPTALRVRCRHSHAAGRVEHSLDEAVLCVAWRDREHVRDRTQARLTDRGQRGVTDS